MLASTSLRNAMVTPKAKAREPNKAATRTEGMNQSLINIDPSRLQGPRRAAPR
jgi:hypothetical protein